MNCTCTASKLVRAMGVAAGVAVLASTAVAAPGKVSRDSEMTSARAEKMTFNAAQASREVDRVDLSDFSAVRNGLAPAPFTPVGTDGVCSGTDEGEPCSLPLPDPDLVNGGCNTDAVNPVLGSLSVGETICGQAANDAASALRDTDWFEVNIAVAGDYTLLLEADGTAVFGFLGDGIAPVVNPDCNTVTAISPFLAGSGSVSASLMAGTYWVFVGDDFSATGCYNYELTLVETASISGACCFGDGTCSDGQNPLDCELAGGTFQGDGTDCASVECAALCGDPASGSCCEANGTPGCDDAECCTTICALDPFCCDTSWDGICAGAAAEECPACFPPSGACCLPGPSGPTCIDGLTEDDCNLQFGVWQGADTTCGDVTCPPELVTPANDDCTNAEDITGAINGAPVPGSNLFATPDFGLPACGGPLTGPAVWYVLDATVGGSQTITIDTCVGGGGGPGGSDCCFPNGTPGCDDVDCEAIVCGLDAFCCDTEWDQLCADAAVANCGMLCDAGMGGGNDCCEANGTPGCEDAECEGLVCAQDAFCCDTEWDGLCADLAADLCGDLCDGAGGPGGTLDDSVINVFTNTIPTFCLGTFCCVAGNDDFCGLLSSVTFCADTTVNEGVYFVLVSGFGGAQGDFNLNVTGDGTECGGGDICVVCDAGDVLEGEPCPTGEDAFNGGCNSTPFIFSSYTLGDTVCGTADAGEGTRDTDWYEVTITTAGTYDMTVTAAFDFAAGFIGDAAGPVVNPNCDIITQINPFVAGLSCTTEVITADLVAGTYWLFVAPSVFEGVDCPDGGECPGNGRYRMTLDLAAAFIPCEVECPVGAVQESQACGELPDSNGGCNNLVPEPYTGPCSVPGPDGAGVPGCSADPECEAIVCALDPFCCETSWDGLCADGAIENCGSGAVGEATFDEVACGDVICGDINADGTTRDTDWFLVSVTNPNGATITATLESEFPGVVLIIDATDCAAPVVLGQGFSSCIEGVISGDAAEATVPPGDYVVFVSSGNPDGTGVFNGVECGVNSAYVLTIDGDCAGVVCPCVGDLNGDCITDALDLGILLGAFGVSDEGDLNGDTVTDALDLGILLGDFNCDGN